MTQTETHPGGWLYEGGCQNPNCRRQIRAGRRWHATPKGFAVIFECNHFATREEGIAALARADVADRTRTHMGKVEVK